MSFGYSVGDLIAGANLTYKLVRIMADTKGASEEYLQTMSEVSAMQQAFLQVGQIRAHKLLPPATVNATSHIVLSSVEIITAFLEKSKKYHCMLENKNATGLQSSWYKVGWTLYKSQELLDLRDALRSSATPLPSSMATYRVADEDNDFTSASTSAPTVASDDRSERGSDTDTLASSTIEINSDKIANPESTPENKPQKEAENNSHRNHLSFKDALGRKFRFPWSIVKHWKGMEELIVSAFEHIDTLGPHVKEGWYDLIAGDGTIILPQVWDQTVSPGAEISMTMWPIDTDRKGPIAFRPAPKGGTASGAIPTNHHQQSEMPPPAPSKTTKRNDSLETSIRNLSKVADALCAEDNYEKAEAIYRQILALQRKKKGPGKSRTVPGELKVGEVLLKQGQYEEAESMFKMALFTARNALGRSHPDTIACLEGLAEAIYEQNEYEAAEKMYRDAVKARTETFGEKHPSTLATMCRVAETLHQQDKYADAEALYREALRAQTVELGAAHEDTVKTMRRLSDTLYQQEKYADAEAVERELLALDTSTRGEDDPETLSTMRELAVMLSKQEKYEEAETTLLLAAERMMDVHGSKAEERMGMLDTLEELAEVIYKQGKHRHADAELLYRRVVERRREHFGDDDDGTLASMRTLGRLLYDAGRFAEAETLFSETLRLRKDLFDENDPLVLESIGDVADVLEKLHGGETLALENSNRKAITAAGETGSPAEGLQDPVPGTGMGDLGANATDTESLSDGMAGVAV